MFAWARSSLKLPEDGKVLEASLSSLPPCGHGLTVLPFLSGERSPGWATDATGVISGLRTSTTPVEVLQAALEGVAFRFGMVWELLAPSASEDVQIIASGGAVTGSPYWLQLMADVLQCAVVTSTEEEATTRGTAILALYGLGTWSKLDSEPSRLGDIYSPNPERALTYQICGEEQRQLYNLLIESKPS